VRFGGARHSVLKIAVMLWHPLGDDVGTSQGISVKGSFDKNGLADFEFVGRHDAPPRRLWLDTSAAGIRCPVGTTER
jgi:hypothetical protein